MRCYVAALASLAACGFTPGTFVTSDGGGSDGPEDVLADPDGDGVLGTADNCPTVANTDQRDHDSDTRGDACDLCPHLSTTTDPDGDGDGIGDTCDPRPAAAGDARVMWEGFYDSTGYATWMGLGSWSVAGGVLTQSNAVPDLTYTYPTGLTLDRHAVTAGVKILELGVVETDDGPGLSVVGGVVDSTQAYYCSLAERADVRAYGYSFWSDLDNNIVQVDDAAWPGTYAVGSEVTLQGRIVGAEHHCIVGQPASPTITVMQVHGPTTGAVMLSTQRAAASFDYVFVVSVGS